MFILRILATPVAIVTTMIAAFMSFLCCMASVAGIVVCVALTVLAVVQFIGGQKLGGCVFLVLAFLVSPYGIPAIADWLEDKLHSLNNTLWRFISI